MERQSEICTVEKRYIKIQSKGKIDIETMKKKKGIESQRNNGERDIQRNRHRDRWTEKQKKKIKRNIDIKKKIDIVRMKLNNRNF